MKIISRNGYYNIFPSTLTGKVDVFSANYLILDIICGTLIIAKGTGKQPISDNYLSFLNTGQYCFISKRSSLRDFTNKYIQFVCTSEIISCLNKRENKLNYVELRIIQLLMEHRSVYYIKQLLHLSTKDVSFGKISALRKLNIPSMQTLIHIRNEWPLLTIHTGNNEKS